MKGTRKRTRRRWVWPVVAALGLSAVVQVGIVVMPDSWYTALLGGPATPGVRQFTVGGNGLVWAVDRVSLGMFGEVVYAQTSSDESLRVEAESQGLPISPALKLPGWSMFAGGSEAGSTTTGSLDPGWDTFAIAERAEGWPWRCVRGELRTVLSWRPQRQTLARTGQVRLRRHTWVPILPIWPGLLLNLVVLALPWYAAYWIHGPGRRVYRRCRGCCTACGYDLAGLDRGTACPECGAVPRAGEPAATAAGVIGPHRRGRGRSRSSWGDRWS